MRVQSIFEVGQVWTHLVSKERFVIHGINDLADIGIFVVLSPIRKNRKFTIEDVKLVKEYECTGNNRKIGNKKIRYKRRQR